MGCKTARSADGNRPQPVEMGTWTLELLAGFHPEVRLGTGVLADGGGEQIQVRYPMINQSEDAQSEHKTQIGEGCPHWTGAVVEDFHLVLLALIDVHLVVARLVACKKQQSSIFSLSNASKLCDLKTKLFVIIFSLVSVETTKANLGSVAAFNHLHTFLNQRTFPLSADLYQIITHFRLHSNKQEHLFGTCATLKTQLHAFSTIIQLPTDVRIYPHSINRDLAGLIDKPSRNQSLTSTEIADTPENSHEIYPNEHR
ncbi:hypothetical protein HUJ05_006062 [Dendroctonus ponderosae]|nr:hypothetical protein HUJ05_006062 [Dendroctonus ponderosae]